MNYEYIKHINTNLKVFKLFFSDNSDTMYVILNDIIDREDDINHRIKKNRPIAYNKIKVKVAVFNGLLLGFFGLVYLNLKR